MEDSDSSPTAQRRHGERWELQLKGSGKTPYSRLVTMMGGETSFTVETLRRKRRLPDFIIQEHFPSIVPSDSDRYLEFFSSVVSEAADVIALWLSVGFAHGVCNADNFSLLSITIDYGPFGFMDSYDPRCLPMKIIRPSGITRNKDDSDIKGRRMTED
ncbi:hypothetical protein ASZ78_000073 [Callipepla squamata]|uniref:Selenoprotein O n=1 Tax=Callipepla squamata TaxID=9009 RepID=A0A226MNV3_CALSU|nr:hypothetical protein ASZ78_000073 [Callipepla squamata]